MFLVYDSVNFIARLRSVGVKSSLRAVHDMPHAFWALATAGIPVSIALNGWIDIIAVSLFYQQNNMIGW